MVERCVDGAGEDPAQHCRHRQEDFPCVLGASTLVNLDPWLHHTQAMPCQWSNPRLLTRSANWPKFPGLCVGVLVSQLRLGYNEARNRVATFPKLCCVFYLASLIPMPVDNFREEVSRNICSFQVKRASTEPRKIPSKFSLVNQWVYSGYF